MADSLLRVAMAASSNGFRTRLHDTAVSGVISATTFTGTPQNTADYDPMSMGTLANPGVITVKVDGYYVIASRTSYLGNIDATRMIGTTYHNGSEGVRGSDISGGGASAVVMSTCGMLKLTNGDTVEGVIWVSTGGSTTTAVSTLNSLELAFVGPA